MHHPLHTSFDKMAGQRTLAAIGLEVEIDKMAGQRTPAGFGIDLEVELKKQSDLIHMVELKFEKMSNAMIELEEEHKEDAMLWGRSLNLKLFSRRTFDLISEMIHDSAVAFERGEKLLQLGNKKEELEKSFVAHNLINTNAMIKDFEATVEESRMNLQHLNAQLQEVQDEISLKEDICKCLRATQRNLEVEKASIEFKILFSDHVTRQLKGLAEDFERVIGTLCKRATTVSDNHFRLVSACNKYCELVEEEKDIVVKKTRHKKDQLKTMIWTYESENSFLKSEIIHLTRQLETMESFKGNKMQEQIHGLEYGAKTLEIKKLGNLKAIWKLFQPFPPSLVERNGFKKAAYVYLAMLLVLYFLHGTEFLVGLLIIWNVVCLWYDD